MAPSTEWREVIDGDEEARFARYAEQLAALQREKSKRYGNGRAFHRKQVMALRARLEVLPERPPEARHGLFAEARSFDALVRLSNGSLDVQSDRRPDIRGFGVRVLGVEGPGALGGTTRAQDFTLINRELFGFSKPDEFVELVLALSAGPFSLLRHMTRRHGLFGGLRRLRGIVKSTARPFSGFATEPFFSAAPIACGPYAARVRLLPERTADGAPAADWAAGMRAALQKGPVPYALQLQFFTDERKTPIEDGAVGWSVDDAPFVTVARLTVEPRDLDGPGAAALADEVERATFDPWEALAAHRPLGGIMRARKPAYFASQKARAAS